MFFWVLSLGWLSVSLCYHPPKPSNSCIFSFDEMMTHALLRYLLGFLAPIVLLGIVLLLNKAALDNAGEFADISRIVAAQRADEGLYNGLVHSVQAYKYETYRQANPKIVALGSSRSLQVRDYFFNGDFYNLGGVSADPLRIFNIMDTLFAEHQLQIF